MESKIRIIRHFVAGVAVCLLLILGQNSSGGDPGGQWIVVTPPAFRSSLTPLIEHRKAEGFNVVVVDVLSGDEMGSGVALQARIRQLVHQQKGRNYLLLAGLPETGAVTNSENHVVPGLSGKVGRMEGESSDFGYAFAGPDGVPTVCVGRFPARTTNEIHTMVQKTLTFERNFPPLAWRNRLLLLLGNPGGGALAEMFVEQTLRKDLALLSPAFDVRTIFSAASSRYFLPWPQDREKALEYLQAGQLFSVYLGHSAPQGLGLDAKFITREDWERLSVSQGPGPFFTCGCFANQFGGTGGAGYGLAALRNPNGPVAIIGATGESYSAPGQLAAEGLLKCLSAPPFSSRLGENWIEIQAGLARGRMDEGTFALLDMADGSRGKVPLATQRLEHLEMWMLLGDSVADAHCSCRHYGS
jgi:hypothetical protein